MKSATALCHLPAGGNLLDNHSALPILRQSMSSVSRRVCYLGSVSESAFACTHGVRGQINRQLTVEMLLLTSTDRVPILPYLVLSASFACGADASLVLTESITSLHGLTWKPFPIPCCYIKARVSGGNGGQVFLIVRMTEFFGDVFKCCTSFQVSDRYGDVAKCTTPLSTWQVCCRRLCEPERRSKRLFK